ncbi:thioredoxin-related transmembrane protein 1 isoform X2 [Salvelinus sp. IW2-2015]|uniref:thioredoxin-related transmembrane protein 1 isoform X2 n=1 Tax=Salvelinus sp. IW2-2015 TaxID=2691554 RepID=UPI000CDFC5A6|nr:thioredoxin-related transmembrane protein 1 isoform X2 [Salvelinus alpinus]
MAQLKTKRSCKLLCQTNSPSCKLSCSQLFQPLLSIILVSSIASSAVAETETGVLTITDANWTVTMDGEWMIKFVAPWCPACAQLKEQWERFSSLAAAMGVSVGEVDVTEQPGLSGRFLVTTLPTIFHVKEGSVRRYVSVREAEEFHAYVSNRRWEEVEPLPSWKSPTSPLMSCMAGLFRLSLWIRVLVLVADCLCPSRQKRKEERAVCVSMAEKRQASEADEGEGSNEEEPETLRQRRGQAKRTS